MAELTPSPTPASPLETFQQYLDSDDPRVQRCRGCDHQIFPPRIQCPACGSASMRWLTIGAVATVYSSTTVRRRPDRGGDYNVSLVELAGGARMMSTVIGIEPDRVMIGMSVSPRIDSEDQGRIVFAPIQESL